MKTGYSKICITPPTGTVMCGYYEKRYSKGVLDDLYATAVSFDDGFKKALILTIDVCLLTTDQSDRIRKSVSNKTGVDISAVFVNCSHTHTGPTIEKDLDDEPTNSPYDKTFFELLDIVSVNAFLDMRESTFSVGFGVADGISFSRRFRMKDGCVQTNPGVDNPDILYSLGKPNDNVSFVKIERENSGTLVIVNYGTHADVVGGEYISGDWPNFVIKQVENAFNNTKCVFLTGSQGDVNHINVRPTDVERERLNYNTFDGVPRSYEHSKYMGEKVATAVIEGFYKTKPICSDKLSYGFRTIKVPSNRQNERLEEAKRIVKLHLDGKDHELPYEKMELTTVVAEATRICALENGPDEFEFVLVALKFGDLVLIGLPGECFIEIGQRIENLCDKNTAMVCCLTNGGDTYFPTSTAYEEGGYEARSSILKKGVDDIIVSETEKLILDLRASK